MSGVFTLAVLSSPLHTVYAAYSEAVGRSRVAAHKYDFMLVGGLWVDAVHSAQSAV
jgi:hypothetical protein